MKKPKDKIYYDKKSDALWLLIKSGVEEEVKEVSPGINVELGNNGELLGIEILNASQVLSEKISKKIHPQISPISAQT
ncbi:hypothetical protein A2164_04060 [Candidatus Curtissbacteria bacterium RBG_13_35_7]|uniref:DUF2283 domain-containing protein n=1 Tax=Candidatus Curtissbacteria bacterium RBG_13_35_7 TaxID=1797705 RepID=A0A1F5G5Y6_9BACT|nr:MAG: hypothetical protein A2164_04060 [Candidatus Curtissbacteria bacterium RBG_13_35_7]